MDLLTDYPLILGLCGTPELAEYLEKKLAHIKPLRDALFEEIKGRIKQDDASVPYLDGRHYYYTRFEEGMEYAIHGRRKGSMEAEEEVLVDGNARAEGHDFYRLGNLEIEAP